MLVQILVFGLAYLASGDDQVAGQTPLREAAAPPATASVASRFEPADGRILHFVGGTIGQYDVEREYSAAVGPANAPVGDGIWIDVPGPRDFKVMLGRLAEQLEEHRVAGRMVNLSIGFHDKGVIDGFGTAADEEYATTENLDALVDELADLLARSGVPIFARIGGEVNGSWQGNHPYVFPAAFRKFVTQLRAHGCRNVAAVFCVEPRGDTGVFTRDKQGREKWFPGNEWVDWYGIDVFPVEMFKSRPFRSMHVRRSGARDKSAAAYAATQTLLARAREAQKPVFIGETTCFPHVIPNVGTDPDGVMVRQIWSAWFEPFIAWLDKHPEVKAVSYIPVDWTQTRPFADWGDARIQKHPLMTDLWRRELEKSRWIHLQELKAIRVAR